MREFIDSHWADLIALLLILVGVELDLFGHATLAGNLVSAGLGGLGAGRFRKNNGNNLTNIT